MTETKTETKIEYPLCTHRVDLDEILRKGTSAIPDEYEECLACSGRLEADAKLCADYHSSLEGVLQIDLGGQR